MEGFNINLSNKRYEEIKEAVVDTFNMLDIHCTPISGFEIATKLGAKIFPYSVYKQSTQNLMFRESKDGFSVKKTDGWYIFYNDNMPYGRINNTIMHENGHIVLNHTEDSALAEKEAKFFAKFALAPPVLIHKFNLQNFSEIAERFKISNEAAFYAWKYYKKWLQCSHKIYKDYEIQLCKLFGVAL